MGIVENISIALGKQKPQLVLKNVNVVNVFTRDITVEDVAINDGIIIGMGQYDGIENVDLTGRYLLPGFINAHCHVESSMVEPINYSYAELMWGTTTIITDPHEIVNVAGHKGMEYILSVAKEAPLNYYVQLPSCVPATPMEHAGAVMLSEDLIKYKDDENVLGLGEMMNYVGVIGGDSDVHQKLLSFSDKVIDGHAPSLTGKELDAYILGGIDTEHECTTYEEALEKARKGMAILIREGGASKNLEAIISGVVKNNNSSWNMAFATDDKHLYDIYMEGTIRNNIVKAVGLGMNPIDAVCIATINAARIYGLKNVGAVAPGYKADLVVVDNLSDFNVSDVYKDGKHVVSDRNIIGKDIKKNDLCPDEILNSVNIKEVKISDLVVKEREEYQVIEMIPGQIVTGCKCVSAKELEELKANKEVLKIAVLERHHKTGNIGTGYITGFGLKDGAIATTVAHDSHNLIVVGDDDEHMLKAIDKIVEMQGGYAISNDNGVYGIPLKICGLMSSADPKQFIEDSEKIIELAKEMGVKEGIDPFITLSFMALPVIPTLRITDMGLFNVSEWKFV